MEIKQIDTNFFISDATNIGIVETKNGFAIIDAGIDKDKGKKIKKIIEEKGIKPTYLILTHHHADHTGGARFLKEYFNLKVISSKIEKVFIENPILEPIYLSLGANPKKTFLSKWIKAEEVSVDFDEFSLEIPKDIQLLDLSGHSIGMLGVKAKNFIYASDSFFSKEILDKYIIPYFHNFDKFLEKLEFLKNLDFDYILPSHGNLLTKMESIDVINYNIKRLNEIRENVLDILKEPKTVCEILKDLNLPMHDEVVYTLIESSVIALLQSLESQNLVKTEVKESTLLYQKTN